MQANGDKKLTGSIGIQKGRYPIIGYLPFKKLYVNDMIDAGASSCQDYFTITFVLLSDMLNDTA